MQKKSSVLVVAVERVGLAVKLYLPTVLSARKRLPVLSFTVFASEFQLQIDNSAFCKI